MSILVKCLTKKYGVQKALDTVSFEVPKGKITGFLGPNGAGKSTMMKAVTGYITPTSGSIKVNGLDVTRNLRKVKQITGYLPEHNPLYLDMYVKEFLDFIASSYKIFRKKSRISEVIDRCGLELEQKKKIKTLSKGYRQRVGLAQALVHDPKILILDEPTSGLDPNQLVEIRKVIKEESKKKTVILSTHVMQEVEMLCDKVIIIDKGKIVADDEIRGLKEKGGNLPGYKVELEQKDDIRFFEGRGFSIDHLHHNQYLITGTGDPGKAIMKIVSEHSIPLVNMTRQEQSLEEVFRKTTKNSNV